jgi:hypothetical protein
VSSRSPIISPKNSHPRSNPSFSPTHRGGGGVPYPRPGATAGSQNLPPAISRRQVRLRALLFLRFVRIDLGIELQMRSKSRRNRAGWPGGERRGGVDLTRERSGARPSAGRGTEGWERSGERRAGTELRAGQRDWGGAARGRWLGRTRVREGERPWLGRHARGAERRPRL